MAASIRYPAKESLRVWPPILIAIEKHGSIFTAAKEIAMGYRAMRGKIKATEDRLGQPLPTRRIGGGGGGGPELTPFAKLLIKRYRQLNNLIRTTNAFSAI